MQGVDFFADKDLIHMVAITYAERLFLPAEVAIDTEFLPVRPLAMHVRDTIEHRLAHQSAAWRICVLVYCRCWRA